MCGLLILAMVALTLTSCAEQDIKDSGGIAASTLCHSVRNCTVQNEGSP